MLYFTQCAASILDFFQNIPKNAQLDQIIVNPVVLQIHQNPPDGRDSPPIKKNLKQISIKNKEHWGDLFKVITWDVPEDSIYRKLAACIPVIGEYVSLTNQRSLSEKITTWEGNSTKSRLIFVKNHYKYATLVRNTLTAALVGSLGFSVLFPVVSPLSAVSSVYNAYAIVKNRQLANELLTDHNPIENLSSKLK